jgi:hypothetical protein
LALTLKRRRLDALSLWEVKGYPSTSYRDPARAGEVKPTQPTLQASHWVADAVLKALRTIGRAPEVEFGIAFPDFPRYRRLLGELARPLDQLGIKVLLVAENGAVTEWPVESVAA